MTGSESRSVGYVGLHVCPYARARIKTNKQPYTPYTGGQDPFFELVLELFDAVEIGADEPLPELLGGKSPRHCIQCGRLRAGFHGNRDPWRCLLCAQGGGRPRG